MNESGIRISWGGLLDESMGRTAKIELLRRLLPLALGVLGIWGVTTFLTILVGGACLAAAFAIYFSLPKPRMSSGAVKLRALPPVGVEDAIGFLIGVPFFSAVFVGSSLGGGLAYLLFLFPACLSIPVFFLAIRQETTWLRFFNNGFEVTQLGLTARIRYDELRHVDLRSLRASGMGAWVLGMMGGASRRKVALLNPARETKTMVFHASNGDEFSISCEVIPDLKRVLVGLDHAGVELPHGLATRQKKRTRRLKERLYGKAKVDPAVPQLEHLDSNRIAETIRRYRERKLASG